MSGTWHDNMFEDTEYPSCPTNEGTRVERMKERFTKGPWKTEYDNADTSGGGQCYIVGPAIVRFPYNCGEEKELEASANAFLIEAAPDMYEALKAFCTSAEGLSIVKDGPLDMAQKALAKARGEST